MKSRKRSWTREEVILAMDLYLDKGMAQQEDWDELSAYLRGLPVEQDLAADPTFRNAQGVRNKLYNIQWLDTDGQQGREKGGEATRAAWEEFKEKQGEVPAEAAAVRRAYADLEHRGQNEPEPDEYEAEEGAVVMRVHRHRERDGQITRRKRDKVLDETGTLACEACGFDSQAAYGIPGIAECHHLKAVSALGPGERTRLSDLRIVCPTCHRIIHSKRPWLTWDELVALVG